MLYRAVFACQTFPFSTRGRPESKGPPLYVIWRATASKVMVRSDGDNPASGHPGPLPTRTPFDTGDAVR